MSVCVCVFMSVCGSVVTTEPIGLRNAVWLVNMCLFDLAVLNLPWFDYGCVLCL